MRRNLNTVTITPLLVYHLIRFWLGFIDNSQLKQIFLNTIISRCNKNSLVKWRKDYVQEIMEKNISNDALLHLLQATNTGKTILVSASIDEYVIPLSKMLNIDEVICTTMKRTEKDELSGEMLSKNCYGEEKLNRVLDWINAAKFTGTISSYSDHHSDIPLLVFSDHPTAVNPTKRLLEYAKKVNLNEVHWS
jgi:HAD superfamily phosphoserine phosphatase-like hydrolase